jgi:hypothetical protein
MDLFICFYERLNCGLDGIEEALDDALHGKGQVTGTGTGECGSNVDIEITDPSITPDTALRLVREALKRFAVPESTRIQIGGTRHEV